jgi:hypothetical protein
MVDNYIFLKKDLFIYYVDEYTREKTKPTKVKKRAKKRPQSANASGIDSVRLNRVIKHVFAV